MSWVYLFWFAAGAAVMVLFEWANKALDQRRAKNGRDRFFGGDWRE